MVSTPHVGPTHPRIGIDASAAVGPRTGIGHAAARLLDAMVDQWPEAWPTARVWVNSRRYDVPRDPWAQAGCYEIARSRWPGKVILQGWRHLKRPRVERFLGPIDLIHSPASYIPPTAGARRVLTVHDIYFRYAPHDVEPYGGGYFLRTFERGLPRLDHVIAVSEFTRGELMKHYSLDPDRVSVIPLGVDTRRFVPHHTEGETARIEAMGAKRPYLLCLATIEPRKNLVKLIEGYARARAILHAGGQHAPSLVIAGHTGWGVEALQRRIDQAGIADKVTLLGYVPDEVVPMLYRQAMGFIFPSLYEGFGLPILESMACGCPTILAQAGAIPEVAGSAAHYFNPQSSDGMARALARFVALPYLRDSLRQQGYERAKKFSWDSTARSTIDLYRHVLESPPVAGG